MSLGSLLESRGLTRDNLMACGDGLNDRSMIRFAGVGVAMQNAEPPVKEAADYVTVADNNHDGVAEAIEKFIFFSFPDTNAAQLSFIRFGVEHRLSAVYL